MERVSIADVQGTELTSPLGGTTVVVRGVVTGETGRGFFLQDPDPVDAQVACGIFVYGRGDAPPRGALVEVTGKVVDYAASPDDKPTTQIHRESVQILTHDGPDIEPVWLDAAWMALDNPTLAQRLNLLEGRVVGVPAGSVFCAPSNDFGDYVVRPPAAELPQTDFGGVRIDAARPMRWLPGFRVRQDAPRVDVGDQLAAPVTGPLNYRVQSYQMVATTSVEVLRGTPPPAPPPLVGDAHHVTVMTMNGLNLDAHVEDPSKVQDPDRDVDDDVGDGRYARLAEAVVAQAQSPDVIALQEIQDDDGAEISDVVTADASYRTLVDAIAKAGGPAYEWVDIPPQPGADGGQPGGNIRNGFLFRLDRIACVRGGLRRLGEDHEAFVDSRKALWGTFTFRPTGTEFVVVNVHLASKRHQHGIFAPDHPEHDPRESVRVAQAELIREHVAAHDGLVYVTGDFNDYEFSTTVQALCGADFVNLLERLPPEARHDYNHRGIAQALMHGVVHRDWADTVAYQILHGNDVVGVTPRGTTPRASDHAYVLARLAVPATRSSQPADTRS